MTSNRSVIGSWTLANADKTKDLSLTGHRILLNGQSITLIGFRNCSYLIHTMIKLRLFSNVFFLEGEAHIQGYLTMKDGMFRVFLETVTIGGGPISARM